MDMTPLHSLLSLCDLFGIFGCTVAVVLRAGARNAEALNDGDHGGDCAGYGAHHAWGLVLINA